MTFPERASRLDEATEANATSLASPVSTCDVTPYAADAPPSSYGHFTPTWYGNGDLWAGLAPYYLGRWYAADTTGIKVLWLGDIAGSSDQMTVEARRLANPVAGFRAELAVTTMPGLRPSILVFPNDGCWDVIGRTHDHELRFTVYVHPTKENPIEAGKVTHSSTWGQLRREIDQSHLAALSCDNQQPTQITRMLGPVFGDDPFFLSGLTAGGVVIDESASSDNGVMTKDLRWIVSPTYSGPVLIRGLNLAGSSVQFFRHRDSTSDERKIDGVRSGARPDWRIGSLTLRLPAYGCYALQIDGLDFSHLILFWAGSDSDTRSVTRPLS